MREEKRKEEQRVAGENGTANQPVGTSALALVSRRFKGHGWRGANAAATLL